MKKIYIAFVTLIVLALATTATAQTQTQPDECIVCIERVSTGKPLQFQQECNNYNFDINYIQRNLNLVALSFLKDEKAHKITLDCVLTSPFTNSKYNYRVELQKLHQNQ